jgi:hypothetical protein
MLVVISKDKKRPPSGTLRNKFEGFYSMCLNPADPGYCTKGMPSPLPIVARSATAVDAILNETAEKLMEDNPPDLEIEIHVGKTRKSMLPEQLAKIDDIIAREKEGQKRDAKGRE